MGFVFITVAFAIIAGDSLLDIQASADSAQVRYNGDALTVQENDIDEGFNLYPNPTTGILKIFSNNDLERVVVRNVLGAIVKESKTNQIDISDQANGIYFVELIADKLKIVKKIVLSK